MRKALSIEVRGMDCEGCVNRVTKALKSVKGVSDAEVSLEREYATVWFETERTDEAKIRKAIRKAGYLVGDTTQIQSSN